MDTSENPAAMSSRRYSSSCNAPEMQAVHRPTLLSTGSGRFPRSTTSDTANRPPGFNTRYASRMTRALSADRLITQFEMMTSTVSAGRGMFSISPRRNSTLVAPARRWFSRARASISSVMSRPYAFPVGPTRCAESSTSMPPPEPRSSTVSPGESAANAVGLPHPNEASSASAGIPSVSAASYRLDVIGSHSALFELQLVPQPQVAFWPLAARFAAAPYLARTSSRNVSCAPSDVAPSSVRPRVSVVAGSSPQHSGPQQLPVSVIDAILRSVVVP